MSVQMAATRYIACPECLAVFRKDFPRCPLDGAALESVDELPLIGYTLADRYIIEACIGQGGMGQVYRAKHARISRRFAIKVLHGDLIADGTMRERFSREAEAASRLSHRNLVGVVDFGETHEGLLYLVMDYVEGVCLAELIAEQGPLALDRAVELLRQMAAGLEHAHAKNLVHRDFKPDNVIVTSDADGETAKILDFGIARLGDSVGTLTTDGVVMGTPAFMAPEQATGGALDQRTDLFSLGLTMYEMVAGVLPFEGSAMAVLRQNISLEAPLMSERVPGLVVPPAVEAMVRKLMAKDPADRYQDASELIAEIDALTARTRRPSVSDVPGRRAATAEPHRAATAEPHRAATTRRGRPSGDPVAFADTVHPGDMQPLLAASDEPLDVRGLRRDRRLSPVLAALGGAGALALALALVVMMSSSDRRAGRSADPQAATTPASVGIAAAAWEAAREAEATADDATEAEADDATEADAARAVETAAETPDIERDTDLATDSASAGSEAPGAHRTSSRKKRPDRARKSDKDDSFTPERFLARYKAVHADLDRLREDSTLTGDISRLDTMFTTINYYTYRNPVTGPRDYEKLALIQSEIRALRKRAGGKR